MFSDTTQLVPELTRTFPSGKGPQWLPKKEPWIPPDLSDDVIWAVRAFARGAAGESQQKLLWAYLNYLTGSGDEFSDLSFRPGVEGQRATDFAEGKRFVGLMLRKSLHPALTPKAKAETFSIKSENPAEPVKKKRSRRRKSEQL